MGFEVLASVLMNVAIFWDIAPHSPYVIWCFEGIYHLFRFENQPRKKPACWWLGVCMLY
jgi:hypothetical protein